MRSTTQTRRAKSKVGPHGSDSSPRIALLTPYTGGNFGDAAIQDAAIANIHIRLPLARISGISLNCDNFLARHGASSTFPLLAHVRHFGIPGQKPVPADTQTPISEKPWRKAMRTLKRAVVNLPGGPSAQKCWRGVARTGDEVSHFIRGYRFLRKQDLLVVCGGGQLNEEYHGAWRHPFGLFKWAILAWLAGVPCAVVSVGVGTIKSRASRFLISATLRLACYRSYRDERSKSLLVRLLPQTASDPVVPDLAFSLPSSWLPLPAATRTMAGSRTMIAISPIAVGRPGHWPIENAVLYQRYLYEMGRVVDELLARNYFLIIVISCLEEDQVVIPELLETLNEESRRRLPEQTHIPAVATWQEFVAALRDVDLLISSRLHSAILGFLSGVPTVAISSGAKVDSVMADVGQTDYLLQIRDFTAGEVISALDRLEARRSCALQAIAAFQDRSVRCAALQYDSLAELAMASRRGDDWRNSSS